MGGLCSPGLGPLGGPLFHKGRPSATPIAGDPAATGTRAGTSGPS